jgi:hypothetical protein
MKRIVPILISCAAGLSACNYADPAHTADLQPQLNDSLFQVKSSPFEFAIFLPKDLLINDQAVIRVNEATGEMIVQAGTEFRLVGLSQPVTRRDLDRILTEDGMFTNRVESEDNDVIIYQQFLPGGEPWYYQVIGRAEVSGREYLFRSDPMGEYTLAQVRRMAAAIRRLSSPLA